MTSSFMGWATGGMVKPSTASIGQVWGITSRVQLIWIMFEFSPHFLWDFNFCSMFLILGLKTPLCILQYFIKWLADLGTKQ